MNSHSGEILVERGRLDPEILKQASRLPQAEPGTRIAELLMYLGLATELEIAQILAVRLDQVLRLTCEA